MTLPLVVGVDGSDSSLLAVDWAVDEAARHGVPLRLVYASLWARYEAGLPSVNPRRPSEQVLAEHIVASAADRAERRNPDVKVTTDIVPEDAVDALVRAGDEVFALVTGTRGRGELKGLLLGSVGLGVSARAHCPVVVVRGDRAGLEGAHERILLGLGEADMNAEAVRFAFREAEVRGCVLDVVRAWRRPAYDRNGDRLEPGGPADTYEERASAVINALLKAASAENPHVRTRPAALEGPAGKILVDRSAAADLVIVGARRRTGHLGFQLGCVSHALLHHAQCPVAVVPGRQ
ncbi:universal stress protein [Streptomyces argyrophyllae]|uniref:Universal stress protein n=1 Tax=Streptomyces argyrophylli TaxID=2726118 RepID=A0A6M4Q179_9ACTN|nr:universal stress protein [Streptomyces argyrophyllae]QJS14750.1 universal stress protein [Streptomyces argyrophyllae]